MTAPWMDRAAGGLAVTAVAAALSWLWFQAPWVPLWPVAAAGAGLAAALVVWLSVVPGRPTDLLWSLAAAGFIVVEGAWEYVGLPMLAWPYQAAALVPTLVAVVARSRAADGGWRAGLRVGLGTALLASAGLALVFGAWLGQPVQATVLEASGALARFEASKSTDFLVWAVGDFWGSVPLRLAVGAAVGALAGLGAGFVPRLR